MPLNGTNPQHGKRKAERPANGLDAKRQKTHTARNIHTQATASLPKVGVSDSINLSTFLSTREFEIKALEDGMRRAKKNLTLRAFQSVPRDMRRRTASHNVKKVPKRLRKQATRELKDDNTPTIIKHKIGSRARIRMETAKKLDVLSGKKRASTNGSKSEYDPEHLESPVEPVIGRIPVPKATKDMLRPPPKPPSKFKKRQVHKTWLPTHLWHAKRAKMTDPKSPLWRFAIPLSPTEKSYRPTHRAGGARGVVAWDMSYMSTISLNGTDAALENVLRAVSLRDEKVWGTAGVKWKAGRRTWSGWASRKVGEQYKDIGPTTVIWEANSSIASESRPNGDGIDVEMEQQGTLKRHVLLRTHPTAFLELWTEILRISKQQRPLVHVEDLRFDIGSIEITGANAMEALVGILKPCHKDDDHGNLFKTMTGVTNASCLPPNALLNLTVRDPRLFYPPRKVQVPDPEDTEASFNLLETIAEWSIDSTAPSTMFFNHRSRWDATRLPAQKAINRRKGAAPPGEYPDIIERDPAIPLLLYTQSRVKNTASQGSITLLAPWKCIQPIWYCLMHYPLSSGGNPRLGGLYELQQIAFERERPCFPIDYIGTDAGWAHELEQRKRTKKEWDARPKGKRTCFESLDLGRDRKGEIGNPWACDFEHLLPKVPIAEPSVENLLDGNGVIPDSTDDKSIPLPFSGMTKQHFQTLLLPVKEASDIISRKGLVLTVRVELLTKGTPSPRARIYKLPPPPPSPTSQSQNETTLNESNISTVTQDSTSSKSAPTNLRQLWLSHLPTSSSTPSNTNGITTKTKHSEFTKDGLRRVPHARPVAQSLTDRKIQLAQSLLAEPAPFPRASKSDGVGGYDESIHPPVPNETELIGFLTTGAFNLALGKGMGIGSLVVDRLLNDTGKLEGKGNERFLCIVRNVGENIGRLGIWEAIWE